MSIPTHLDYMSQALQLAERGRYTVSPNPMVGCLIVKDNRIIAEGHHRKAGGDHAEIDALKKVGMHAHDATMYVTLEPCCHVGRTPPCVDAVIKSGIKKVYVACTDANPLVAGNGIKRLRDADIQVEVGLLAAEAKRLNEFFFHYITHQRPFVIAKWAMSLDGKTITHPEDSRDISCAKSRENTHQTRREVDAILVGSKTAIHDNPLLTVRMNASSDQPIKHPLRIILSSKGNIPLNLKIFDPEMPAKTIVATTDEADSTWLHDLAKLNIETLIIAKNKQDQIDLVHLLDVLGKRQITSLLIEGGMATHERFFAENLVNKVHVYLAPVIIGSLKNKQFVNNLTFTSIERDFHFIADYKE